MLKTAVGKPPRPVRCYVKVYCVGVYERNGKHIGQITVYADPESVLQTVESALREKFK